MEKVQRAKRMAKLRHIGQKDLAGEHYYYHLETVAHIVEKFTEGLEDRKDYIIVAWLHDILEDTNTTEKELIKRGYSTKVVEAIKQMSRDNKTDYEDYIKGITSKITRVVKMADLTHNMDTKRFGEEKRLTKGQNKRIIKYRRALKELAKSEDEIEELEEIYANYTKEDQKRGEMTHWKQKQVKQ